MTECDVLVVGAGPAGAVTSLVCAEKGLNTILVEKNRALGGGTKTKLDASSGDELSKIIDELDLLVENKVYKSKWHPPSGNYFLLESSTPEYFFKRGPANDSFEVSAARKSELDGSKIYLNTKVEDVESSGDSIDSVVARKGGEKILFKARVIVAADGGNSIFHRLISKSSANRKKIGYGLSGKNFSEKDSSNVFFDSELIKGGYFYLITGRSGLSSACIVLDPIFSKKSPKNHFEMFLKKNPKIASKIKNPTNYFGGEGQIFDMNTYFHKNIVFVGDAAGLIDPFFGYGMTSAIVSGYQAGNFAAKALDKDLGVLEKYDTNIKDKFDKRLSYLYQRVFESLNNVDLELAAEILKELDKRTNIEILLKQLTK